MKVNREVVENAIHEPQANNKKVTISAVMKLTGYYYYALTNAGYHYLAGKYTKKNKQEMELEEFEDLWFPKKEAPKAPASEQVEGEHFLAEFKEGDQIKTATFKTTKELLSYIENTISQMEADKKNRRTYHFGDRTIKDISTELTIYRIVSK